MMHPENVWTGRNDVTTSIECVVRSKDDISPSTGMSKSKDIFSIKIRSKFSFQIDVNSSLVSQFDLQNKKYCIRLQLVVALVQVLGRSLHPRVVYLSRAIYSFYQLLLLLLLYFQQVLLLLLLLLSSIELDCVVIDIVIVLSLLLSLLLLPIQLLSLLLFVLASDRLVSRLVTLETIGFV